MADLILGLGRSGIAVARHLNQRGGRWFCYDDKGLQPWPDDIRNELEKNWFDVAMWSDVDRLVVSPGVPMEHPMLLHARENHVPVISEIEYAFNQAEGPVIAVTGSNGKSTTVTLIHHLLRDGGLNAVLCGNIGDAFTAQLRNESCIYVVEVSSFQLEHIVEFRPKVALLLNVSADHLDRHHSLKAYEDAKFRIFENQSPDDLAIIDTTFRGRSHGQGQTIWVPDLGVGWHDNRFELGSFGSFEMNSVPLLGDHNRLNILFASLAVASLGVPTSQIAHSLASFKGLEHRLETVGTCHGVTWINDSKATNPASTQVAIDAMVNPYVLILGGSDKDTDFRLLNFDVHPPKHIVAYGDTGPKALEQLPGKVRFVADFSEACAAAHALASHGEVVLLSPACASFDQFNNYTERGKRFKQLFQLLECSS